MSFDPNLFMQSVVNDANATSLPLIPQGDYVGTIADLKPTTGKVKDGDRMGEDWYGLEFNIICEDPKVLLGDQKVRKIRFNTYIDLNANGGLSTDPDRNITLGRIREATGLNVPGQPFAPYMLEGRTIRFSVGTPRTDSKDPTKQYDNISGFRKL